MEPVDAIDYLSDAAPAPGRLAVVERFVNTVDHENGREMLHSVERTREVLASLGLHARVTRADVERLRELREQLRALAGANNGIPTKVVLDEPVRVRVGADGGELVGRDAASVLAGIVYTAMADGTWARLKTCRRDECRWVFYDHSRNHSSTWCSMAVCGNRTKTQAYRARKASARRPARSDRR